MIREIAIATITFTTMLLPQTNVEPPLLIIENEVRQERSILEQPEEIVEKECEYYSCIVTARELGIPIPLGTNAIDIVPNDIYPHIGGLAIFKYGDSLNKYHVVIVVKVIEDGFWGEGGNKPSCQFTKDFYSFDNPNLLGFRHYIE